MTHRLYMVDVFAERRYAGNPLAVIVGEAYPPAEEMQRIAAEMNFSETTFVLAEPDEQGSFPMRIFTPSRKSSSPGIRCWGRPGSCAAIWPQWIRW